MDKRRVGMVAALSMMAAGATMGGAEVIPRVDIGPTLPKDWGYRRQRSRNRTPRSGNPAGTKIAKKAAASELTKRC